MLTCYIRIMLSIYEHDNFCSSSAVVLAPFTTRFVLIQISAMEMSPAIVLGVVVAAREVQIHFGILDLIWFVNFEI